MSKTAVKPAINATELAEIRYLQRFLTNAFPSAKIKLDEPISADGVWSLDLVLPAYHLGVAWKKGKGFGIVSDDTHGYGEGADEVYASLDEALPKIVGLIAERRSTAPPEAVKLRELRESRGLSQEEVARRMGSKQASISRLEARSDVLISTLRKQAKALGALSVKVSIVFPDCEKSVKFGDAE